MRHIKHTCNCGSIEVEHDALIVVFVCVFVFVFVLVLVFAVQNVDHSLVVCTTHEGRAMLTATQSHDNDSTT